MAKSTHSQEALTGTSESYSRHELSDADVMLSQRITLGNTAALQRKGDEEWPEVGGDSTPPSESESSASDRQTQSPHSRAQTTESHLPPPGPDNSDADLTDGGGQKTEPQQSAKLPARKAPAKKAVPRKTTDDYDFE